MTKKIVRRTQAEVFHLWKNALRSGGYSQTGGRLRKTYYNYHAARPQHSYCCLGVLCQLAKNDGGDMEYDLEENCHLPDDLREWLGISDADESGLIHLNDDEGYSFKQIADHIEKKIEPKVLKTLKQKVIV